jgi:NADPH:quinone reductase-like Zn-dependent oxidoreductase
MRAVVINEFCKTLAEVKVDDAPQPRPKPNELLIKVHAAGVNFVDTLYVRRTTALQSEKSNRELILDHCRREENIRTIELLFGHHSPSG